MTVKLVYMERPTYIKWNRPFSIHSKSFFEISFVTEVVVVFVIGNEQRFSYIYIYVQYI